MDPTNTHSQEPEGDFTKITQCSNPAGDEVDHPSADELTSQTDGSLPQVSTEDNKETKFGTDTTEETSSEDDRSEIGYDAGKNGEDEHLEKDKKESWSSVEDKKGPEDVLKEIQMQKTHGLYCPNCTHTITGTAELFEKGQETLPYNNERFIFVIVLTFKYPFIYLRWLYNNSPEPVPAQPEPLPAPEPVKKLETKPIPPVSPKGPVIPNQPIPLVSPKGPVEPNQPNPLPPKVPSEPKPDNTSDTLLEKIRDKLPNRLPKLTPTSQRLLLFLVLLLLSGILLLTLAPRPSPPPPSPPSPTPRPINPENPEEIGVQPSPGGNQKRETGKRGGVSFSWLTNFLSNNYISIILLLFLAILAVLWRSMPEGPNNDPHEAGAVTNPQIPDDDTAPPVKVIIPETKTKINEDLPSSIKLLPIKLDILKSIVYGGLIESITSFGVVSSAAATGTSTLNVLSLGLANLFTGFFIIIHNLHGLFKRPRYQRLNDDDMPQETIDPYEERLGERHRVILHCFVVLVSFIFFAVIPPLFYGFSFKITDRGCYQEAAIFIATSLACVISLSFSKAYAFGMDKLTTVAVYTGITICGSSLSYIASQYAIGVFAKYDFHKLAAGYFER